MSTLKATNLQHASAASPAIVLASSGSATAQLSSINDGPIAGARNRIINGDMRIDQRNAGASVTPGNASYTLDRWQASLTQSSKFTVQQNAGSVTPPAGFKNYLGVTSSSAYSIVSGDIFAIGHGIEGYNVADLEFGTANAKTITLSFWVRSSLTGTFGGAVVNTDVTTRSYPFSYSISSSNTWEYKTITIPGDTTGAYDTTNGLGLRLRFSLGSGSTYAGTAGSWSSSNFWTATGATSVVGTNGATFYITGVQLEPGSVATPFERRSYGQELALCQRYYQSFNAFFQAGNVATIEYYLEHWLGNPMRSSPTVSVDSYITGTWTGSGAYGTRGIVGSATNSLSIKFQSNSSGVGHAAGIKCSAEL